MNICLETLGWSRRLGGRSMVISRHGRLLIGNRIPFQCEGFGQTESEVVKELLESAVAGAVDDRHGLDLPGRLVYCLNVV